MWRQLLRIAEGASVGEMDRSVQEGRYTLPRDMADNMVDTLREMDQHDLAIMTLGLVDLIRRLMVECSQVLANARSDLVEVEVEPEEEADRSSLVQTGLGVPGRKGVKPPCSGVLEDLQLELDRLQRQGWNIDQHIGALLAKARQHRVSCGGCELLDLLNSLLVALRSDAAESSSDLAVSKPISDWLAKWWTRVQQCLPGSSHEELGGATLVDSQSAGSQTQGQPEDASLYAEAEAIAVEEHEYRLEQRRLAEERARQEDEHESSLESWESEMQRVMEMFAPYEAAKEARAWDNWAMWDSMNRPQVRTRAHVEVEVGPEDGCRGECKRLKLPVPECCGDEVVVKQVRILRGESSPDSSAPTVTVPATKEPVVWVAAGRRRNGQRLAGPPWSGLQQLPHAVPSLVPRRDWGCLHHTDVGGRHS